MTTSEFSTKSGKQLPVTAAQLGTGLVAGAGGLYGLLRDLSRPKRETSEEESVTLPVKLASGPNPGVLPDDVFAPAPVKNPLVDPPPRPTSSAPVPSKAGPLAVAAPVEKAGPPAPEVSAQETGGPPPLDPGWGGWLKGKADDFAAEANQHPWRTLGAIGLGGLGGYGLYRALAGDDEDDEDASPVKTAGLLGSMFSAARRGESCDSLLKWAGDDSREDVADRATAEVAGRSGKLALRALATSPLIGAVMAPSGHVMEGGARGLGSAAGGVLGAIGGGLLGNSLGGGAGTLLGGAGGGLAGVIGSRKLMGPPSWELKDDEEDGE